MLRSGLYCCQYLPLVDTRKGVQKLCTLSVRVTVFFVYLKAISCIDFTIYFIVTGRSGTIWQFQVTLKQVPGEVVGSSS